MLIVKGVKFKKLQHLMINWENKRERVKRNVDSFFVIQLFNFLAAFTEEKKHGKSKYKYVCAKVRGEEN